MKQIKYFFLLAMAMMSLTSFAQEEEEVTWTATYNSSLKGYTVAPNPNTLESYEVPATILWNGNPKTVIGLTKEAFKGNTALKSVTFAAPEDIVFIGSDAFNGTGLESIDLSGLTNANLKFEASIFEDCTSLTSFKLPTTVTGLGQWMFNGCTALESVDISDLTNVTKGMNIFEGCTSLESAKLPSSMVEIGQSFFDGCTKLTTVNFSDLTALTTFGQNAFRNTAITEVDLSNSTSLTTISNFAFRKCAELASVTLPSSVTSIGRYSFGECPKLESVNFEDLENLTKIDQYAFTASIITEADLSNTQISTFGQYAFANCKSLETVKVPATLTSFGTKPFNYATVKVLDLSELTSVPQDKDLGVTPKEIDLSGLDMYNAFMADANWGTTSLEKIYVFPIKVNITDAKYATFCAPRDLDFTGSDVKAYIATGFNAKKSTVKVSNVTSVPKGTGVLLECATAGEYEIEQKAAEGDLTNLFVGTLENINLAQVDGENTNLVLSKKNGVVGFYKAKDGMNFAINKAYLPVPTDLLATFEKPADCLSFSFEGETDGIEMNEVNVADGAYYTLQGVKVNEPSQKGVYIHNGKKIMVK